MMSYCSENRIPREVSFSRVIEVIELLGYEKVRDFLKLENQVASYVWDGDKNHISFVGIELYVYKYDDYFSVQTRTRAGRSYWDLEHQNKTIRILKGLFGGAFSTDEGTNRYMKFDCSEPSKLECSIYLARWRLNNALHKPLIYLSSRELNHDLARKELTGMYWLDELNPVLLSNNMLIPYIIGCWEAYFRQLFVGVLNYADGVTEHSLKGCRLSNSELFHAVREPESLVWLLADSLSFQRPSVISENFKRLNPAIDICGWLKKPYHRRKKTLFDSITSLIELRDTIVHAGVISHNVSDKEIQQVLSDLSEAADRVYDGLGVVYGFVPDYNF